VLVRLNRGVERREQVAAAVDADETTFMWARSSQFRNEQTLHWHNALRFAPPQSQVIVRELSLDANGGVGTG
jgi:hypothetical protein